MKLYCLSGHPTLPCNVLKFKSTTIMLDCGLDMTSVLNFIPLPLVHSSRLSTLPSWIMKDGNSILEKGFKDCAGRVFIDSLPEFCLPEKELLDLSTIDVILISNYHCMMALPYITEHTGFTGTVYTTEPTLQIARLLMEELVHFIERVPKDQSAVYWKSKEMWRLLPSSLKDAVDVTTWKPCYNIQDVNAALSKVQLVGYSQKIELFGAVQITPLSSGYSLGSCNWIIQSHYEKVSCVSGSSLLTTHPQTTTGPQKGCFLLVRKNDNRRCWSAVGSYECLKVPRTHMTRETRADLRGFVSAVAAGEAVEKEGHHDSLGLPMGKFHLPAPPHPSGRRLQRRANPATVAALLWTRLPSPPAPLTLYGGRVSPAKATLRAKGTPPEPPAITESQPTVDIPVDQSHTLAASCGASTSAQLASPADKAQQIGTHLPPTQIRAVPACNTESMTIRSGGNVLVPCYPSGVVYDLLECLYQFIDSASLNSTPFYFISPVANSSLEFSQIFAEWLCQSKQSKVYLPEPPFPHAELADSLMPIEMKPGVSVATISATLHSKDNKHVLQPPLKTMVPPLSKKRKRVIEEPTELKAPKPLLSGTIPVELFLATLHKVPESGGREERHSAKAASN
ncbi:integrator complex subunit 9 [Polypterus senegalus]|uniref:integrator complex subunit 9 n=1 Tax=Polypterus senegalus TaxID=55291 RepID=UPI001963ED81|nr:integrator complex subunit 9 [Polypterus senegalus]